MEKSKGIVENFIPKETKKIKIVNWILVVLFILGMGIMLGMYLVPTNPLQQYITTRTCDFVSMGGFNTAVCTDGTAWTISPFQQ